MYLTSRAQGRPRATHDHEQLELLLESFAKQVEEIVSEIDTTVVSVLQQGESHRTIILMSRQTFSLRRR